MMIRDAVIQDCDAITSVHLRSFSRFFLSSLGERFLKTFYKACIKSPETVAVVCCTLTNEITGFAVGTSRAEGYYKRLLIKNLPDFSLEAVLLLFTRPNALIRLTLNLSKSKGIEGPDDTAELLSIGTLPEFKGSGIGRQLIEAFETKLKERKCKSVSLTTDFCNNEDVIRFYQNSGYEIKNDFTTYPDRRMYRMIKTL